MPSQPEPKAGEIWDVWFEPVVGREQGGRRPALVISGDAFNELPNGLVVVAPITRRDRGLSLHVRIQEAEGGLNTSSVIMCDQTRAVSLLRLKRQRGSVTAETLGRVRSLVARIIDS